QALCFDAFPGQTQEAQEGGGRIARSAAPAAADGNAFGQHSAYSMRESNSAGQQKNRAIDEVVRSRLRGKLRISGDAQLDAGFSRGLQLQRVVQGHGLED